MHVANNFSYGPLTPVLGYLLSCLGAFLSLRCASRALAGSGAGRTRWLALAALSLGTTGIWVMHFTAMLGYTISGETIRYSVPVTILSMVIAVAAAAFGLFVIGFADGQRGALVVGGTITGAGIASVHYVDMAGMRMDSGMSDNRLLLAVTVIIAIAGSVTLLWAVPRLRGVWPTIGAALITGAVVSGLHYTGMAGMHLSSAAMSGMSDGMPAGGATAGRFLLPLIIGISIAAFALAAILALSPSAEEIHAEEQLMASIGRHRVGRPPGRPSLAAGTKAAGAKTAGADRIPAGGEPVPGSLFVSARKDYPASSARHGRPEEPPEPSEEPPEPLRPRPYARHLARGQETAKVD
jgi:NO-binding membrane sensor protein with MHYT domain